MEACCGAVFERSEEFVPLFLSSLCPTAVVLRKFERREDSFPLLLSSVSLVCLSYVCLLRLCPATVVLGN